MCGLKLERGGGEYREAMTGSGVEWRGGGM